MMHKDIWCMKTYDVWSHVMYEVILFMKSYDSVWWLSDDMVWHMRTYANIPIAVWTNIPAWHIALSSSNSVFPLRLYFLYSVVAVIKNPAELWRPSFGPITKYSVVEFTLIKSCSLSILLTVLFVLLKQHTNRNLYYKHLFEPPARHFCARSTRHHFFFFLKKRTSLARSSGGLTHCGSLDCGLCEIPSNIRLGIRCLTMFLGGHWAVAPHAQALIRARTVSHLKSQLWNMDMRRI